MNSKHVTLNLQHIFVEKKKNWLITFFYVNDGDDGNMQFLFVCMFLGTCDTSECPESHPEMLSNGNCSDGVNECSPCTSSPQASQCPMRKIFNSKGEQNFSEFAAFSFLLKQSTLSRNAENCLIFWVLFDQNVYSALFLPFLAKIFLGLNNIMFWLYSP